MAAVYSRQFISASAFTPPSRYIRRSIGFSSRSRKVRSPSNTRAMYKPRGCISTTRTTTKSKNCNQPFAVISEFLQIQESHHKIGKQQYRDCNNNDQGQVHGFISGVRRP